MSSDNPSGADNQQERPVLSNCLDGIPHDLGHYIAGFVEGEGSFNVPIVRLSAGNLPWRVTLSFNVSQVGPEMPNLLRSTLGVGRTRGRPDGVFYFEVTKPDHLNESIFPFFRRFPLRGPKAKDLEIFMEITALVRRNRHLTPIGFEEILKLRAPMNRGGKRRRSDEEIIAVLKEWESSEAIRRAPLLKRVDEDMVQPL